MTNGESSAESTSPATETASEPRDERVQVRKRWLRWGAMPLILYPFVFGANVMSLSAEREFGSPNKTYGEWAFLVFLWGSTLYPLVYMFAEFGYAIAHRMRLEFVSTIISRLPVYYLLSMVMLFAFAYIVNEG